MKNKLVGVDVRKWKNDETDVIFWREDGKNKLSRIEIPIHTTATYNRLYETLNNRNKSVCIHAKSYSLSIDMLFSEVK